MPLTKEQKKEIVKYLSVKFKTQKSVVFNDFTGLTVAEIQDLRKELKKSQADYKVVKKTLLRLALEKAQLPIAEINQINSSVAVAMSEKDETEPASILFKFSKTHSNLKILAGLLGNQSLSGEDVINLAKLPSKQELRQQVVRGILSPIANIVSVLRAPYSQLVFALRNLQQIKIKN